MVNPAVVIFFTMIFVCGVTFGVTQSLVNLRLQDLNAPSSMIGMNLNIENSQNYISSQTKVKQLPPTFPRPEDRKVIEPSQDW